MISIDKLLKREKEIIELEKTNSKLEGELSASMERLKKEFELNSLEDAEEFIQKLKKEIQKDEKAYAELEEEYNEKFR